MTKKFMWDFVFFSFDIQRRWYETILELSRFIPNGYEQKRASETCQTEL